LPEVWLEHYDWSTGVAQFTTMKQFSLQIVIVYVLPQHLLIQQHLTLLVIVIGYLRTIPFTAFIIFFTKSRISFRLPLVLDSILLGRLL